MQRTGLLAALCAIGVTAAAASAAAPPGRSHAPRHSRVACGERTGRTQLETSIARVYAAKGRVYVCRRPSGPSRFLFGTKVAGDRRLELAGRFVAWVAPGHPAAAVVEEIAVLDLVTARSR